MGKVFQLRGKYSPHLKQLKGRTSYFHRASPVFPSVCSCSFSKIIPFSPVFQHLLSHFFLSLVKLDGMFLTSARFIWNLICYYLTIQRKNEHTTQVIQLLFCVWRGKGWGKKVNSDVNMVKVQHDFQKEMPKLGNWNLDVTQLQLDQEERNGFNRICLV